MENCIMCAGWGTIHPEATKEKYQSGDLMLIWLPSIGAYYGNDIDCPLCDGAGKVEENPQMTEPIKAKVT